MIANRQTHTQTDRQTDRHAHGNTRRSPIGVGLDIALTAVEFIAAVAAIISSAADVSSSDADVRVGTLEPVRCTAC